LLRQSAFSNGNCQGKNDACFHLPSVIFNLFHRNNLCGILVILFLLHGFTSGFPIWFLAHDRRGLFLVILVTFVLLHSFATHFSVRHWVLSGAGGVSTPFLAPMSDFSRM
jgi:hypothetical protein